MNYLIGARHVTPRLHTAGSGPAFKGKENTFKRPVGGQRGTLSHHYTCYHCLRVPLSWDDRSVSTKNREEKSIRPSSLWAHTTHWRFPCGACARMHVSWIDAIVPQLCMWLHSRWRFGESWQMDGSTILLTACLNDSLSSHSVSAAQARVLSKISLCTRYLAE